MGKKIVMIIFIIAICPIIFCGCWNYMEIDNLAIVSGLAIDKDMTTNKYIVTAEIITAQTQGTSSTISSELYSSEGESIFIAVRDMIEETGLRLFWSEAKVVIISDSVAKSGVIPVIDWINRSHEIRADIWMLIANGNSAAEILKAKVNLNGVVSFHLDDTMKSGKTLSKFTSSRLWSFVDGLSSEGKAQAVATIKNDLNAGTIKPRLKGSAIFKSDKLIGYLDGNETLYMLMIKSELKEGLINLKNISGSDTSITLEIYGNKTKLTPLYDNGAVSLLIDIYPVVGIEEVEGTKDFMKDEKLNILKEEAEEKIEADVQRVIDKLQKDYDSDILGFGEVFEKEKPKVSKYFKKSGEDIFVNIKTKVNVHLQIKGSGKTTKPISIGN